MGDAIIVLARISHINDRVFENSSIKLLKWTLLSEMNALKCRTLGVTPFKIFMVLGKYYIAHAHFLQENGRLYVWLSTDGVLDLCNVVISEKTPQIF